MTAGLAAAPPAADRAGVPRAALALEEEWRRGAGPSLEEHRARLGPGAPIAALAALIKADLRGRFALGQRPAAADYLARFPELRDERDRVVSLVYEEYCLREEAGEPLDPDRFCDRYEPWRDSLESQLRFHRLLSQVAGTAPPRPKFPAPGERFLKFRLRAVLGRGGDGHVYLAHEEELGDRPVALKVSPDRGREPAVMGRLDHPHIVPVLSVAREERTGLRGLCMPYRPGRPLHEVIRRVDPAGRPRLARALREAAAPDDAGGLDARECPGWAGFPRRGTYAEGVAWVVMTLARALGHAHARGILHRDVKPANILLTARDGPQLLDFNLAHDPLAAADQAQAALNGGTLPYMAPEQLAAFLDPARLGDVGPAADLFALGLVLVELLTGRRPEAPDPELPLPRAIAELRDRRLGAPPSARALNPGVPHALDAIVARCLAPHPAGRYPSAEALADDLGRFLAHRPARLAPNPSRPERLRVWALRNRPWLAGALVLGLAGLAAPLASRPSSLDRLRERAASAPHSAAPHVAYGLALEADGKLDDAQAAFAKADGLDGARRAYAEAMRSHPASASPREGLGFTMIAALRYSDALSYFGEAQRLAPGSPTALIGRGVVLEERGQADEAQALYDRARGRPAAAPAFARAARADPRAGRVSAMLGLALLDEGQWDEARRTLERELQRNPGLDTAYRGLAVIAVDRDEDLGKGHDLLSRAIACAEGPPLRAPGVLAALCKERAEVAIKWADRLRVTGRSSEAGAPDPDDLYRRAVADLGRVRRSWRAGQGGGRAEAEIDLLEVEAEIGRGEIASKASAPERASAPILAARRLVEHALAVDPANAKASILKADLDRRLGADLH